MRAILLASATVATCGRLRDVRLTSHVLRPEDCLVFCNSTVCAPCTKSLRRYLFPRLLVPVSFCLPPVECSPGTTPSHAANPRPFLKAAPLPMAATVAVAMIGPIPGIAIRRLHCSSSPQMRAISLSASSICPCRYCISNRSRSEEHTSELQSLRHLVCRLLLEKKKKQ